MGLTKTRCWSCKKKRRRESGTLHTPEKKEFWKLIDGKMTCWMCWPALTNPFYDWIQNNLAELHKYPDEFIALDPAKGILIHSLDSNDFARLLETLSAEENEKVTLFHSSMYLRFEKE